MPRKRTRELSLSEKAERALRRAVRKVVEERRLHGEPVAVWKNGRAVWLRLGKSQ